MSARQIDNDLPELKHAVGYERKKRFDDIGEQAFMAVGPASARVRPPRFELIPLSRIQINKARNYLVKGLVPRRGLAVAYGAPKCGKSFWKFDLMMHVALGWPYRGRRVQQGAVVYLCMEGQDGFRNRIAAFRTLLPDDFADEIPMYLIFTSVDLIKDRAELIKNIRAQLGSVIPAAVVIDTLNRTLVGSESKDEDMANYLRAAGDIENAFDCAVSIVHHSGLEAGRPRGHTSLTGAADVLLSVVKDTAGNIVVTVERNKDGPEGETVVSKLETVEVGTDDDGDRLTSCVIREVDQAQADDEVRLSKNQKTMFGILHDAGAAGLTTEDWNGKAREAGIGISRKADLYDIRSSLVSKKLIRQFGERWTVAPC
jgi:hypothetical protein